MKVPIAKEYVDSVIKLAALMQKNSKGKQILDYDKIIAACGEGEMDLDVVDEAKVRLVQDIRVLIEFPKNAFVRPGITCTDYKNHMYLFQDAEGIELQIDYDVLTFEEPQIYAIITDYHGKRRKSRADNLKNAWKKAKLIDIG